MPTIRLVSGAQAAFECWERAFKEARHEIFCEMYWVENDALGQRFIELLAARAKDGVDVRLVYDGFGSVSAGDALFNVIREAGGMVREFHPLYPWRRGFSLRGVAERDHRKLIIVDGAVGFVGGFNLANTVAPKHWGGEDWRDYAAMVTGEPAGALRALFLETWASLHRTAKAALVSAAAEAEKIQRDAEYVYAGVTIRASHAIRRAYIERIHRARTRVLIANAYFIPDPKIRRALRKAARRGVEVRVLVSEHSDVPHASFASRATFEGLLREGVHVHFWPHGVLHSKVAVVDQWGTVGSYNLDYQSWRFNLEVNVLSSEPSFVEELEQRLRRDLDLSREVTLGEWEKRPVVEKALEWFFYRFRKLL